ncbi:MAG: HAD-IA family hydrolase [Lachnospiraceae bacterium]|nr:HAD-IA family hydrolase [Lachnospiraceae bacterium]
MKKDYSVIFFDVDGTLTDSGTGIMNGFAYAIEKMGGRVEDRSMLKQFVGPPLRDSFGRVLGYSQEDTEKAVAFYREYYNGMGGSLENSVYPGVEELLKRLAERGKRLVVATSKGARGTDFVLEHFGLKKYFEIIATANDCDRQHKNEVIGYALKLCGIQDMNSVVMVGDRENDISGAKCFGMDSIGVLYGYGSREELTEAGATYLAETAADVEKYV